MSLQIQVQKFGLSKAISWKKQNLFLRMNLGDLKHLRKRRKKISTTSLLTFQTSNHFLIPGENPDGREIIKSFLPYDLYHLFCSYSLTPKETKLLKAFGHTSEELKAFEEKMNLDRISRIREEDFKEYLGWSVAAFHDHFRMWGGHEVGKKLIGWLKENHDPEDWWYAY